MLVINVEERNLDHSDTVLRSNRDSDPNSSANSGANPRVLSPEIDNGANSLTQCHLNMHLHSCFVKGDNTC